MFYSQFILAKKGPLGTIWIAAHLERKLRKNQVADTDIGVSVDSILFPDVPIALRLSSHLLLGVVRIYSRKVNYLFDDCSEALLKIKQAFRSTAVDLPPEQSKAPYHSITLPETFDLDDFELPDNDIYQGIYVDHHVSSREQITLQDTLEREAYSTTRFGLDERFGDADTSGLDLDEDLFLDKVGVSRDAGMSDPRASAQTMRALKGGDDEGITANLVPTLDGIGEDVNLIGDAQAPRTPGLVEEPNFSNAQETSACDDHFDPEDHQLTEFAVRGNLGNISGEKDILHGDKIVDHWSLPNIRSSHSVVHMPSENEYHSGDLDSKQMEMSSATEVAVEHISPQHACASGPSSLLDNRVTEASLVPQIADKIVEDSDFPYQTKNTGGAVGHDKTIHESLEDQATPMIGVSDDLESTAILGKSHSPSNHLDGDVDFQGRICRDPKESNISSFDVKEKVTGAEFPALRPCSAHLDQPDSSNPQGDQSVDPHISDGNATYGSVETSGRGETSHVSEIITGEYNMRDCVSDEGVHSAIGKSNDKSDNRNLRDGMVENVNSSAGLDLPSPEKLLSVMEVPDELPSNVVLESTPGDLVRDDECDAGSSIISGKKRSYTESTLTEQSLNSVESSRMVRSKLTVESIPDDDDLLSSILVGRKSSFLKVKPTPTTEITSVKRISSASRTSANKRKVLVDDIMVLHGDTIRQQLMNTEDIRRVRKKAPCTRPEVSKLHKQLVEDEMFMEPVYTGVSVELTSLHNQAYDLSGIRISLDDVNCVALESSTDKTLNTDDKCNHRDLNSENTVDSSALNSTKDGEKEGTSELLSVAEDCKREAVTVNESKLDEHDGVEFNKTEFTADTEPDSLLLEPHGVVAETDLVGKSSIADGVNTILPGADESSLLTDQVLGDQGDISTDVAQVAPLDDNSAGMVQTADSIETCKGNASLHNDASDISCDQQVVEASLQMDTTGGKVVEGDDVVGKDCDIGVEPQTGYEVLLTEAEDNVTVESAPDANDRQREYNSHSLASKGIGQSMMDSSFPREVDRHMEDVLLDDGERPSEEVLNSLNTKDDAETSVVYDHDALNYYAAENETEFLNVDEDEVAEPADDNISSEEARIIENSGWSSRTRAVANYLQTLFVKQAGNGRPTLLMDNLLVGKTRKEASRMFFEALVLKTKDYIHVEQGNPFESITLKPQLKLMKSDF